MLDEALGQVKQSGLVVDGKDGYRRDLKNAISPRYSGFSQVTEMPNCGDRYRTKSTT